MLTRRQLAPALAGLVRKSPRRIEGGFVFESQERGHLIRDRIRLGPPKETRRIPVAIVGGGVAGLSAGWWLQRNGLDGFAVLELEDTAGGNARGGRNEVAAFPWGAHYLPVPDAKAELVRELCRELGLLNADGSWEERWLCHAPQERLFIHGRWQEGLEPQVGLTREDARQFERFFERMREFHQSGQFSVPMERGSAGGSGAELDRLTMAGWMRDNGFYSQPLHWLVDYSCRDDYGTHSREISAWAGIHYFASRPDEEGPLTWPQGNSWIVERLMKRLKGHVQTGRMVYRVERAGTRWRVLTAREAWECEAVIFAAPTYLAAYLVDPAPPAWPMDYAPWVVANLTLDRLPDQRGAEPAWDSVIYGSPSLGYVDARHQELGVHRPRTVWTAYWALAAGRGADQRRLLLGGDWAWWKERILTDLERAHPDIRQCVSRLDIHRMGHAMPKPLPGTIFHPERLRRARAEGTLVYANSDLSALSLFEEAQWRGVEAARRVLRLLGKAG